MIVTCCGTCKHAEYIETDTIRCRMWHIAPVAHCRDACDGQREDRCVPWCVSSGTLEKYKAMRPEREKENHECKD